jgi:ureidoglycolate hydrolase
MALILLTKNTAHTNINFIYLGLVVVAITSGIFHLTLLFLGKNTSFSLFCYLFRICGLFI